MYGGKRASQPLLGMICCQPGVCLTWVSTDPHWRGNVWWVPHNCPAWQFMMGLLVWLGRAWLGLLRTFHFPHQKEARLQMGRAEQRRAEGESRQPARESHPIDLAGGRQIHPYSQNCLSAVGTFCSLHLGTRRPREGGGGGRRGEGEEGKKPPGADRFSRRSRGCCPVSGRK